MMLVTSVVVVVFCCMQVSGCSESDPTPSPYESGDSSGSDNDYFASDFDDDDESVSGGSNGGESTEPVQDPLVCSDVQCNPPPCCGGPCTSDGDCCDGTLCSDAGDCIPASCNYCGELGCTVNFADCTAECITPDICLNPCSDDGDCMGGTFCSPMQQGGDACVPDGCKSCGGMKPTCSTSDDCTYECIAPPSCGDLCSSDTECGPFGECLEFDNGIQRCTPEGFQQICNGCPDGCLFNDQDCTMECDYSEQQTPDQPDPEPDPDPDPEPDPDPDPEPDPDPDPEPDVSEEEAGTQCAACCEPCTTDADCCMGFCGENLEGQRTCLPGQCSVCTHGCTFYCP